MAYPQKLLSDGETVAFEMRPHWRALVVPGLVLVLVVFGAAFGLTMVNNRLSEGSTTSTVSTWVIWVVALFVFVVFVIRPFLYWVTTQYVFTNRRIIVRSGLVARHGRDMPLSKVNNVSFDVSVPGRLLNYGTLTIDSASDEALIINDVPSVEQIQREVNRLHEEDDERRRSRLASEMAPAPQPQPQPVQQQPQPTQVFPAQEQYPPQQYPPQQQSDRWPPAAEPPER